MIRQLAEYAAPSGAVRSRTLAALACWTACPGNRQTSARTESNSRDVVRSICLNLFLNFITAKAALAMCLRPQGSHYNPLSNSFRCVKSHRSFVICWLTDKAPRTVRRNKGRKAKRAVHPFRKAPPVFGRRSQLDERATNSVKPWFTLRRDGHEAFASVSVSCSPDKVKLHRSCPPAAGQRLSAQPTTAR